MTGSDLTSVWTAIREDPLPAGAIQRRCLPGLGHDVFVGETRPDHRRFLAIRAYEPVTTHRQGNLSSRGLHVTLTLETPDRAHLLIAERDLPGTTQFTELVDDLLRLIAADPGAGMMLRIIDRLRAWQQFFSRDPGISAARAAGLFAELTVLESGLGGIVDVHKALEHWTGPDPGLQDFQLESIAVEVKSYRGGGAGGFYVASERQLETEGSGRLIIAYVEVDQREAGVGSTLSDIVESVRGSLGSDRQHLLQDKLLAAGVSPRQLETVLWRHVTRSIEWFEVCGDFPRLTTRDLPIGISEVSYRVARSALTPFQINPNELTDKTEAQ